MTNCCGILYAVWIYTWYNLLHSHHCCQICCYRKLINIFWPDLRIYEHLFIAGMLWYNLPHLERSETGNQYCTSSDWLLLSYHETFLSWREWPFLEWLCPFNKAQRLTEWFDKDENYANQLLWPSHLPDEHLRE